MPSLYINTGCTNIFHVFKDYISIHILYAHANLNLCGIKCIKLIFVLKYFKLVFIQLYLNTYFLTPVCRIKHKQSQNWLLSSLAAQFWSWHSSSKGGRKTFRGVVKNADRGVLALAVPPVKRVYNFDVFFKVQGDQLYMAMYFYYVSSNMWLVQCTRVQ